MKYNRNTENNRSFKKMQYRVQPRVCDVFLGMQSVKKQYPANHLFQLKCDLLPMTTNVANRIMENSEAFYIKWKSIIVITAIQTESVPWADYYGL